MRQFSAKLQLQNGKGVRKTTFVTTIFLLFFLPYTAFSDGTIRLKMTTNHIPPSGVYDRKGHTWVWGIDGKSILQTSQTEFQLAPGTHKINYSTRSFSGGALSQSSNDLEFTVEDGHTYEVKLSNENKPIVVDLKKVKSDSSSKNTDELVGDLCSRLKAALHYGGNTIVATGAELLVNGNLVAKGEYCCGKMSNVSRDFALQQYGCK